MNFDGKVTSLLADLARVRPAGREVIELSVRCGRSTDVPFSVKLVEWNSTPPPVHSYEYEYDHTSTIPTRKYITTVLVLGCYWCYPYSRALLEAAERWRDGSCSYYRLKKYSKRSKVVLIEDLRAHCLLLAGLDQGLKWPHRCWRIESGVHTSSVPFFLVARINLLGMLPCHGGT